MYCTGSNDTMLTNEGDSEVMHPVLIMITKYGQNSKLQLIA